MFDDLYTIKKKIIDFTRSAKFEIKYVFRNIFYNEKLRARRVAKQNEANKKLYNFILAREFMEKFECGERDENILDYGTDLYRFEDVYLTSYGECSFIHKYGSDGKPYAFKESAGIVKRIDSPDMHFTPPLDLTSPNVEEDEVCLACFVLGDNYWHFTCDIFPKIMIMEKLGYKGKYLVNAGKTVREFLALLNIPQERLIFCKRGEVIHAKKVHMFDESYGIELRGQWLADTREYIMNRLEEIHGKLISDKYPKKIYVSRIGTRRIINEIELTSYLMPLGFAVIVPEHISILEQIKLFVNADIIVTPHGANATNILYSKKGTTLVECFGHYWVNPCMVTTVEMLDIDYRMICERFMHNIPNTNKNSNYIIDMTLLKCTIKKVFEFRGEEIPAGQ